MTHAGASSWGDDEWPALSRLLDEVLERGPAERAAWPHSLPPEHAALAPRLRRLLADAESPAANAFLDTMPKIDGTNGTWTDGGGESGTSPGSVGPYRIVQKLGEGGMGAVWLARRDDVMVNRLVALKIPRGTWPRQGLAERMAREREILATLNHPNIARLLDAGVTSDGQPFLVLEYVAGRRIDEYAAAERLGVQAKLRLFLQVAHAVAHAHARLIVHRDLKPSNVLVTAGGEVKLLDFGVAKMLAGGGADTAITDAAGLPMTPDYASPEQIAGEPLSIASDVYSLGVLLYELLTGVRPYMLRRDSRGALEDAILQAPPRRPSDATPDRGLRRTLRGDLDTIVLKALKKKPGERYGTVDALAEDIARYLDGRVVLARPDGPWYRLSKFVGRHAAAVSVTALVLSSATAGAAVIVRQAQAAFTERVRADEVRHFLTTILREASPYNGAGRALAASEWLKHITARVDERLGDRPELRVELLNVMGSSLLTLQDTDAAETVLRRAMHEGTRRLGATHPETLRSRVLLTGVYRFRGTATEMRRELDSLVPLLRAAQPALAEHLVIALRSQAFLDIDTGRYAAAERAAHEALELGTTRLGERHPETVAAVLVVAWAYQFSRDAGEALVAAERAYRLARTVYRDAPIHPRIIEGRLLYGRALGEAGQVAEGAGQLAHAVNDATEVFGPSSRMVGFFSVPLAKFQMMAGEIPEALETSRRSLDIVTGHTAPESFRYAAVLQSRGAALLAARRAADALPYLARAVETLQRTLPPKHAVTRAFAADQSLALTLLGRHKEAEQVASRHMPDDARVQDRYTARLRYALGVARRARREYESAVQLQRRALVSVADDPAAVLERMNVLAELGLNLLALEQPAEATSALTEALALSRRVQTRTTPERADVLLALARLRLAAGRPAAALSLLQEADRFWRGFDRTHTSARETESLLARCAEALRVPSEERDIARHDAMSAFVPGSRVVG